MSDHDFYTCLKSANEVISNGGHVWQKFTCGQCGNRLTMPDPDAFYKEGTCDKCGALTNIEENGCNYLVVYSNDKKFVEVITSSIQNVGSGKDA